MNLHVVSEAIEWLEHKTKPLFVIVALVLYAWELVRISAEYSPTKELDSFLTSALTALSVPFGIILLQELLELIANMGESNLLSAQHQFEIVVLVIVRSFFKSFGKVSGYVSRGEFGEPVQESVVKIVAILAMIVLIFIFRWLRNRDVIKNYAQGRNTNLYKQILVVILSIFVLIYLLFVRQEFDEIIFISLIFTGVIIIDAVFLILQIIWDSGFESLTFEASLIIALIFARFALFSSNILSYSLSVLGTAFATGALYVMWRAIGIFFPDGVPIEEEAHQGTH